MTAPSTPLEARGGGSDDVPEGGRLTKVVTADVLDKIPGRIAELEAAEAEELRFADNLRSHAEQHDGYAMQSRRQIIGLERILKDNGR